jgi:hypothetical protein
VGALIAYLGAESAARSVSIRGNYVASPPASLLTCTPDLSLISRIRPDGDRQDGKPLPQSPRRNVLRVERINRLLLMRHEHPACALCYKVFHPL